MGRAGCISSSSADLGRRRASHASNPTVVPQRDIFLRVAANCHSLVTVLAYQFVTFVFGLGGNMSINSANPRRFAIAAGYGALAVGLPYGAYASSPETSAWALMALCVCGLGFAGYRRSRSNRLSCGIE
jgi:hypothetical protein